MKKSEGISKIVFLIVVLVVLAAGFAGFRLISRKDSVEEPPKSVADIRAEKGVPVKVMEVESLPWELWKRYYGKVRPSKTQDVTSFVREFIVDVPVEVGDAVQAGDVLLELSTETQAFDLSARVADYNEARRDYERKLALSKAGGISKQEVERAYVTMEQKRSLVADVRTKVSRTKVYAKIDGTVSYKDVEVGEIAEPGRNLLTVADITNLEVEVLLPPIEIGRIVKGIPVRVTMQSRDCPNPETCGGVVLRIDPEADPSTGLYKCIVSLASGSNFPPGSYVETEFLVDARDKVIQIPYELIKREDERTLVYVVEEGRAFKRFVQLGEGVDRVVEIVSGLTPGEMVVTEGVEDVFDSASVWIQE